MAVVVVHLADRVQPVVHQAPALAVDRGLFVRVYPGVDVGSAAAAIQVGRDTGFEAVTYVPAK